MEFGAINYFVGVVRGRCSVLSVRRVKLKVDGDGKILIPNGFEIFR